MNVQNWKGKREHTSQLTLSHTPIEDIFGFDWKSIMIWN